MNRVTFISHTDWANISTLYAKALQSVGVDAKAYAFNHHPFNYENQAEKIRSIAHLEEIYRNTDVIVYMHSTFTETLGFEFKKKVVFHGGSFYRNNHETMNRFWNKNADSAIIQTYDLWDACDHKDKHWIMPPYDEEIKPKYDNHGTAQLVVGHFPSSVLKGTDQYVLPALQNWMGELIEFRCGDYKNPMTHSEVLYNMSKTDVVADCLYPEGLKCGCFGLQTIEACALGKIIITNNVHEKEYNQEYGVSPSFILNDGTKLREQILYILNNLKNIKEMKMNNRLWVETNHSYKKIGERLLKVIE